MKNVLMIGIGLIGSSIALCLKESNEDLRVTGFSLNQEELEGATSAQIIDDWEMDLQKASEAADVIFLCTPVSVTLKIMEEISSFNLKSDVLITDVGSTKKEIMNQSTLLTSKGCQFVGGHPMAGSHKSGFLAADKNLFENAYYILVPSSEKNKQSVADLHVLLRGTKAKFIQLTANEHDEMTGILSHTPHIIAAELVHQADQLIGDFPMAKKLAAGGFRDITRIASSDAKMWADISVSNQEVLVGELDKWLVSLGNLKRTIEEKNWQKLYDFFDLAKKIRDDIPVHKEGSIPAFHDLYVNVPDYPGAIAEVTGILAKEQISLINIKIMETRDDIFGILCISFKNEKELKQAQTVINQQTAYSSLIN